VRPRYLGIEVAGQPVPRLLPAAWLDLLNHRWRAQNDTPLKLKVIRSEGTRAIVAIDQRTAPRARLAWNATWQAGEGRTFRVATVRSWGTLVDAKAWLRGHPP